MPRSQRSWRGLLPGEPRIRAVVAIFVVGACIVAGSIIAPSRSSDRAPTATTPRPLTTVRAFKWGRFDDPGKVAPAPDGSAWIADQHRAMIYRLSEGGDHRKYPLRGIEDPREKYGSVVYGLASDRAGNAWVLAAGEWPKMFLIGLTPSGTELARYAVPQATSLAVDRDGYAWMSYDLEPKGGVAITSVALRSGATKHYRAFPGAQLWASARPDPRGGAQLVGELWKRSADGSSTVVAARVTRDGVTARSVGWPRSLRQSITPDFTVGRDGDIWLGVHGGLARIDAKGTVTAYPLFASTVVLALHTQADGHILFSTLIGPVTVLPEPFAGLSSFGYMGELDPEHPTRLPVLQMEPDGDDAGKSFGVTRRRAAVLPDAASHRVLLMPLTVPHPVSPASRQLSARIKRIISRHHAELDRLEDNWDRHIKDDARPYAREAVRIIARTRTRLLAAASTSTIVPDPLVARLIARSAASGKRAIERLTSMARFPRTPSQHSRYHGRFLFSYTVVVGQLSADLYELAEVLGLPPTAWDGRTTWKTKRF